MMRIAALTWTDRLAGGVEAYVQHVLPELEAAGHVVSLWHEASEPSTQPLLALRPSIERHRSDGDVHASVSRLDRWRPDVILANGLSDTALERALQALAPTVFVAHNYHGTCISGTKCWSVPVRRPCRRTFGAGCLAHYFPHRCGGISPITMLRLYRTAEARLDTVRACRSVVALSHHMRTEYVAHGLDPDRVVVLPYGPPPPEHAPDRMPRRNGTLGLAAVGRFESLKGFDLLLDALPAVARGCDRPVELVLVGDGRERLALEARARGIAGDADDVSVTFKGWRSARDRDEIVAGADLFVLPSPWPEPFGIAGLEAGHLGVPVVAFDVGGVSEWLRDGENGRLARAEPPSAAALAAAVVAAAEDPAGLERMGRRARALARARSPERHAAALAGVLGETADRTACAS